MPTDFQDVLSGLVNTSPVHRVTVRESDSGGLSVTLDVQQYRHDIDELAEIESRFRALCPLQFELRRHHVGELFPEVYNQTLFKTAQNQKRLSFHDERREGWIVTY